MELTEASVAGWKQPESPHQQSHPADMFSDPYDEVIAQHMQQGYDEINSSGGNACEYLNESLQRLLTFSLVCHLMIKVRITAQEMPKPDLHIHIQSTNKTTFLRQFLFQLHKPKTVKQL